MAPRLALLRARQAQGQLTKLRRAHHRPQYGRQAGARLDDPRDHLRRGPVECGDDVGAGPPALVVPAGQLAHALHADVVRGRPARGPAAEHRVAYVGQRRAGADCEVRARVAGAYGQRDGPDQAGTDRPIRRSVAGGARRGGGRHRPAVLHPPRLDDRARVLEHVEDLGRPVVAGRVWGPPAPARCARSGPGCRDHVTPRGPGGPRHRGRHASPGTAPSRRRAGRRRWRPAPSPRARRPSPVGACVPRG